MAYRFMLRQPLLEGSQQDESSSPDDAVSGAKGSVVGHSCSEPDRARSARQVRSHSSPRALGYDSVSPWSVAEPQGEDQGDAEARGGRARWARSRSPVFSRRGGPLTRRTLTKNAAFGFGVGVGTNPVFELNSFRFQAQYCKNADCCRRLSPEEREHETGLCDDCYDLCQKDCFLCKKQLRLKNLLLQTPLCAECFERCAKVCQTCGTCLAKEQLHWDTGRCDKCWDNLKTACRVCEKQLKEELKYNIGLCDDCYDCVIKFCRMCHTQIAEEQLRYGSGMCNGCYDKFGKKCKKCSKELRLGMAHWRSRMCDACFASCEKFCNKCNVAVDDSHKMWATTHLCNLCFEKLKEGKCMKCGRIESSFEKKSGTGLCNACYDAGDKECQRCHEQMRFGDKRWGSGLCNRCYDQCEKKCKKCERRIPLHANAFNSTLCDMCFTKAMKQCGECNSDISYASLHWGTGLCDPCYDRLQQTDAPSPPARRPAGLSGGVWAVIVAQFVFYASPGMLQPSLYLQIEHANYPPSPAAAFAAVLMAAAFAAMIAPVPLGCWADRRGEREVYCGMAAVGVASSLLFLFPLPIPCFALAWAAMNLPPAIRGVRAAYFAKHVEPDELSRASNFATAFGLLGGFLGPLVSVLVELNIGDETYHGWLNTFTAGAGISSAIFVLCWVLLATVLATRKVARRRSPSNMGSGSVCERCDKALSEEEMRFIAPPLCNKCFRRRCERCNELFDNDQLSKQLQNTTALCDNCWDNFGGQNKSFKHFRQEVLISFCIISMLLELGMNAAVIATFQPLAVEYFRWGNNAIAAVNFGGAGLSVIISMTMALLRLPERRQMGYAAAMYFSGVLLYACPPLSEWRLVVGLMIGIKAQILFMAPFTAIFSRLIGGVRFTNNLSTCLCLAPAIGAAIGTSMAPAFVAVAGTPYALLAVLPSTVAIAFIAARWQWLREGPRVERRPPLPVPCEA